MARLIYEFRGFRLDSTRRELRLDGDEIALQPRIFDLLSYLIGHRDRVVSKEELLEAVWPDVVVGDGSIKRAVSLARAALRQGGSADAIRTYPRKGYRFCLPEVTELEATDDRPEPSRSGPCDGAELERRAETAQLDGKIPQAIGGFERAVAAYEREDDRQGAARAALGLALIHFERLELSVAKGWLGRAAELLPEGKRSHEHGLLAGLAGRFAVAEGDYERAIEECERAVAIGRELSDADIRLLGMSYLGIALVARGDVERGIAIHDEAAATVLSGASTPRIGGLVYCGLIWTCRNRGDWKRAAEWTECFSRWCAEDSLELFSGNCRLHRAEVLHHRGDLTAAEREAQEACRLLADLAPFAEGDACRVLGDLQRARGDLEGARDSYRRAHELGWDPHPGLALLQVAEGHADAGLRALQRSLQETTWANLQRRGLLLASLVRVALAADRPELAASALAELDAHSELWSTTALQAEVARARAEMRAYAGDVGGAIALLRQAIADWQSNDAQLQAARQRLRLAELYLEDDDPKAAELELEASRARFEALGLKWEGEKR